MLLPRVRTETPISYLPIKCFCSNQLPYPSTKTINEVEIDNLSKGNVSHLPGPLKLVNRLNKNDLAVSLCFQTLCDAKLTRFKMF